MENGERNVSNMDKKDIIKEITRQLYTLFGFPVVKAGYKLYQVSKNTHSQLLLRELDGQPEEGYTLTRAKEEQIKKLDSLGATSIDIAIAKVENICKQTTKTEVVREYKF